MSRHRDREQGSEEEEEELGLLGTLVDIPEDPEVTKRPIPVHEQVVTDERGRRRFHGAFTGGFSAGYFNTVGSKEGVGGGEGWGRRGGGERKEFGSEGSGRGKNGREKRWQKV